MALVRVERCGRAVTARAAERQLTLRRAERRARVGGEAAGRSAPLLGWTQKIVLTPFLRLPRAMCCQAYSLQSRVPMERGAKESNRPPNK